MRQLNLLSSKVLNVSSLALQLQQGMHKYDSMLTLGTNLFKPLHCSIRMKILVLLCSHRLLCTMLSKLVCRYSSQAPIKSVYLQTN